MGNHSAVYFGICNNYDENHARFKIGETTGTANARMRQQKYSNRPDFNIVEYHERFEKPYSDAERVFIEGYVRMRYSQLDGMVLDGKDFFLYNVALYTKVYLCRIFKQFVSEAENIVDHMPIHESMNLKPIIPAGHEEVFNFILKETGCKGSCILKIQMSKNEEQRYLQMLETALCPCGYSCISRRNYSWACFEIKKLYK